MLTTYLPDPATVLVFQLANIKQWAYASAFRFTSTTVDGNGAIATGSIVWPDGATGAFTTDVASTAFPGAIDAWHATYVTGNVTRTVTQAQVTRNATSGVVTSQPEITVA